MEPLVHGVLNACSNLVIWTVHEWRAGTCALRSRLEHQDELDVVVGVSARHRLFGSKHRLSKPNSAGCSTAPPRPAAPPRHALLLPRQLVLSPLSCAARFIFFMEGMGMSEASKRRRR